MMNKTLGWKAKYATDITSIDAEHKELLEQINTLASILENQGRDPALRGRVIDSYRSIHQHTVTHFGNEERVMRNIKFPYIDEHIGQHKELLQELEQFEKMVMEDSPPEHWEPRASMLNVLILRHIMTSDIKIRVFLHRDHT